jgi:hypothetical protein
VLANPPPGAPDQSAAAEEHQSEIAGTAVDWRETVTAGNAIDGELTFDEIGARHFGVEPGRGAELPLSHQIADERRRQCVDSRSELGARRRVGLGAYCPLVLEAKSFVALVLHVLTEAFHSGGRRMKQPGRCGRPGWRRDEVIVRAWRHSVERGRGISNCEATGSTVFSCSATSRSISLRISG